jgi:hypothetical protein
MVAAITLLHQYQREQRTITIAGRSLAYLQATEQDVKAGLELARLVLASGVDSLPPQARRLLAVVEERASAVAANGNGTSFAVTRRELRERLGWSDRQVRSATDRLVEAEYLVVSAGGRGRLRTYSLVADYGAAEGQLAAVRHPGGANFITTSARRNITVRPVGPHIAGK